MASLLVASGFAFSAAVASQNPLDSLHGGPTDFFTVSDGTSIAMTVCYPRSYVAGNRYPAILEMGGYENGSQGIAPNAFGPGTQTCSGRTTTGQLRDWFAENSNLNPPDPPLAGDSHDGAMGQHYDNDYFVIHASVRGSGCSGGEFDLFSHLSALDGYDLIEHYIVNQPWSNKKVGIIGHSYSGITGSFIAETQPPHLGAVSVSGLIDDLYRGITYPGGIFNGLFPPEWTLGVRPAYDVVGGSLQGVLRDLRDRPDLAAQCAANIATHRRAVLNDPLVQGVNQTDNDWFRARSLIDQVDRINVPFQVTGAFQDEQTGPRFEHFWEKIAGVPKRMLMSNGHHGTDVDPPLIWQDRVAWLDYFLRGAPDPFVDPGANPTSVRTFFELANDNTTNEIKDSTSFPVADTTWTPLYVDGVDATSGSGTLATAVATSSGSASYLSGTKRQSWSYEVASDTGQDPGPPATTRHAPDELEFRYPFAGSSPVAIDGPITANLFLSTTGTDTDLFVQVIDEFDGTVSILQRGMLRASHAAGIESDAGYSNYFGADPVHGGPFLYRPWRTHSNPQPVTPGAVNEYLVEIFPVAHIFRPGHTLLVKLTAPPAVDSQYSYTPGTPPATVNTLVFSPAQKSRFTLPVVNAPAMVAADGPGCGNENSVRCFPE